MSLDIDWRFLRTLNGSQDDAFEELSCQLAHQESAPAGASFVRKGKPDAGVECFWQLSDGTEWAWQAKFFPLPLSSSQWQQIDDSIRTAINKHPLLRRYIVCIPQDRSDARVPQTKSFLKKWGERLRKWRLWTAKAKMSVDFEFWGTHEFLLRLSTKNNAGRFRFWFGKDVITPEWCAAHVREQTKNAGPRYTPELNVHVPISCRFDWLTRSQQTLKSIREDLGKIIEEYRMVERILSRSESKISVKPLVTAFAPLIALLETLPSDPAQVAGLIGARTAFEGAVNVLNETERILLNHPDATADQQKLPGRDQDVSHKFHEAMDIVREFRRLVYQFQQTCDSVEAKILDDPELLIIGVAGTGKTHLLCDIASDRVRRGVPTLLLLGEQFGDGPPWSQILSLTRLALSDEHELLGALDAAAEAAGERALIIIDALNEGGGLELWPKYLAGFRQVVKQYPRVALALSIRDPYQIGVFGDDQAIWPPTIHHEGFAEIIEDACQRYFEHYGIQSPTVPLLHPEFDNPLFLKTFCAAMKNAGISIIPVGFEGISRILDFYLSSLRRRLFGSAFLDEDPNALRVQRMANLFAQRMASSENRWISLEQATACIAEGLGVNDASKYLAILVSEGLLSRDLFYVHETKERVEGIRFGYERFTDHLVAQYLVEQHLDFKRPSTSFRPTKPLGKICTCDDDVWTREGLLEALSVQVPERVGKELFSLLPRKARKGHLLAPFLNSLIWRRADAVTVAAMNVVEKNANRDAEWFQKFLPTLLLLAVRPDHKLNVRYLNGLLAPLSMAKRDAWWSVFTHRAYGDSQGPVSRLIRWAWADHDRDRVDDEVLEHAATVLCWLFTSSNRFLRDRATKALVSMLSHRIGLFRNLFERFKDVNDPYVRERLYCAAYGCAMRTHDMQGLRNLGAHVWRTVFCARRVFPDLMFRDYAAGIVRIAVHRAEAKPADGRKLTPALGASWPRKLPTLEELEPFFHGNSNKRLGNEAQSIWFSVGEWGDFSRYVIDSQSWAVPRFSDRARQTVREHVQRFLTSLNKRQKFLMVSYVRELSRGLIAIRDRKDRAAAAALRKSLPPSQQGIFDELVQPFLKESKGASDIEPRLPHELIARFILKRIVEFGWQGKYFDGFDRLGHGYMREAHKAERIGKKYQWIAYHEALARISDNFPMWRSYGGESENYRGPWQLNRRDIDPSFLLLRTPRQHWHHDRSWWNQIEATALDADCSDLQWLQNEHGIPAASALIEIDDPVSSGTQWLNLHAYASWGQKAKPGHSSSEVRRRSMWYVLDAYAIKKSELSTVLKWGQSRRVEYIDTPSVSYGGDVFYGEFPWAPAFQDERSHYSGNGGWVTDRHLPVPVLMLADFYSQSDSGYDCSVEDLVQIRLPSAPLIQQLHLDGRGMDGRWYRQPGELAAQDPSVYEPGPSALLFQRELLAQWLREEGFAMFWVLRGEKQIIGGDVSHENWPGRLLYQGVFTFAGTEVMGNLRTWFDSPRHRGKAARPSGKKRRS